ncbi:L,D-transpeptidase family protein [Mesorhizobium australicum]|uniref:Murein L,D-transpeptidase YcbB/YkuD n=1 Tax=Mesorhizobium australicum TaxID=536018 RepID=A0A1X7PB03_9HYPH|nr:L,D-transpeptidase family protein [Mesorhizobium australicum]SMH47445.1 Murein L,D-transpeptidase YcbB/YkuD [Mesorhizobium australicum]
MRALAAGAAMGMFVVANVQPAEAQNFFDRLFGGGAQRRSDFPPPPPPPEKRAAKPIAKISAPSYYTYKVDSLAKVKVPQASASAAVPELTLVVASGVRFSEAMPLLGELDLVAEKEVADAIAAHYAAHPEFVWISGYGLNSRAQQALRVLADASSHGLDPADYSVEVPRASFSIDDMASRQRELARFELTLSAKVLRYVRDAARGRIDPNRLSGYHDFAPKQLDLAGTLDKLSRTFDTAVLLESYHPQNEEYRQLRAELESLSAQEENDIVVDPNLLLRPGGKSAELPKLIALIERKATPDFATRHSVLLALSREKEDYTPDLVPLIKDAQEEHGLKGDGVIGPRTVQALAGVSRTDRIAKVKVALEQLRWLPSDLGARRVFINQPAFTATYFEDNAEKLSMRVVIGRPSNQTSFFQDVIEQIDYNPYWGVPQSIIVNEMLPRLRGDPGYLDRAGYEVTDAKGKRIPSAAINWGQFGGKVPYSVRQSPSEANALGELKILFPNKHAIYMHDTPQKALFDRESRAFSHGCVRLHQPREMAAALLGKDIDYVKTKLAAGHSSEKIPGDIPVYVAYFTAWPNKDGVVEYFPDVYGRDEKVLTAIEKTEAVRVPAS